MAIRNTTQLPQPVSSASPLPTQIPLLPASVVKRFPEVAAFNEELDRFWRKNRELLRRDIDDLALPINKLYSDPNNLTAVDGQLLAEIRSIRIAQVDGDEALSARIDTIVASSGSGVHTYVQSLAPTGAAVGDIWYRLPDFRVFRWDGSAWIDVSDERIAGNMAAVTDEATARANADSAMASQITAVIARLDTGDIATALSSLFASVGPGGALASAITSISARLDTGDIATALSSLTASATTTAANAAAITSISARLNTGDIATAISQLQVDVGPSGSLATQINALSAASGNHIYFQNDPPATANPGDYWIDTNDGNKPHVWNGTAWVDVTDDDLTATMAAVTTITSSYATKTYAEAMRDDAITAAVVSANGFTTGEISSLSSVYATVGSVTTQIADAQTSAVTTANGYTNAQITSLSTTMADADEALSDRIDTLVASSGNHVFIQPTPPTATGPNDVWYDSDDGYRPHAWVSGAWVDTSDGRIATNAAAVVTEASARATADGFLASKYTLKVIAGNVVTGMNFTSASGTGVDISDITFQASSFRVFNGTSGVAPFQVIGGQVRISGSLSVDGSVTTDKLSVGSFTNLVRNGSFEDGSTPISWAVMEAGGAYTVQVITEALSAGFAPDGNNCIQLATTGIAPTNRASITSTPFPVYPGRTYAFRFFAVASTTNPGFYARVNYFSVNPGAPNAAGTAVDSMANAPLTTGWTRYQFTQTAPAGMRYACVTFYNYPTVTEIGQIYIDGVEFYTQSGSVDIEDGAVTLSKLNFTPATSSNIVATINASSEGLLISAAKIQINGSVTFAAGYDPSSKVDGSYVSSAISTKANADMSNVTTIDGGKITTGSIAANRLSVSNLAEIAGVLDVGSGGGRVRIDASNMTYGYGSGFGTVNFTNNGSNQITLTVGGIYGVIMQGGSAGGTVKVGTLSSPGGTYTDTIADVLTEYRVGGVRVVGSRLSTIATVAPTNNWNVDQGPFAGAINSIIGALRTHGLIA